MRIVARIHTPIVSTVHNAIAIVVDKILASQNRSIDREPRPHARINHGNNHPITGHSFFVQALQVQPGHIEQIGVVIGIRAGEG